MRVLISGATGFVGTALCRVLEARGDEIVVLTRDPERARGRLGALAGAHAWDPLAGPPPPAALDGVDAIVHLAGESVAGRWTAGKRRAIRESRELGTRHLVDGILQADPRPRALVSSSAIGYYGDRGDAPLDEAEPSGNDFLAEVCVAWENEARRAEAGGVRVARMRTGIVLDEAGGALGQMLTPARLGLSGPLGSGRQWWSWISRDDAVRGYLHALDGALEGAVNLTSPGPVRQAEFAKTLGRVLRRPAFLPAPAFALRLALGGFSAELLSSKRVLPARLEASGFDFRDPELDGALRAILG